MTELSRLAARTLLASFDGATVPSWMRRRIEAGLGGVCLYDTNPLHANAIGELTSALHETDPSLITCLDEEGGDVTRLHYGEGSPHAGAAVLGAADDLALTEAVARDIGRELHAYGVDLDLGPVADVNSNPANPVIGVRSFGADADLVARHTAAWVSGLQSTGVGACLKHFPGHGDTVADSHLALPVAGAPRELLAARELLPFRAGAQAGAVAVMTSHVVVPAIDREQPATLSAAVTQVLRDPTPRGGVGFTGLLISDALDMAGASGTIGIPAAAVRALQAGVDLLCLGPSHTDESVGAVEQAIIKAVEAGELAEARLIEAAGRVAAAVDRMHELRCATPTLGVPAEPSDSASARAARAAVSVSGALPSLAGAHVMRLVTGTNLAVGVVPWGLSGGGVVLAGRAADDVHEHEELPPIDPQGPLVVVVRDAVRYPWVMARLREIAGRAPGVVVVELGWPRVELGQSLPGVTVVHSYGASAVSAAAVDAALAGAPTRQEARS